MSQGNETGNFTVEVYEGKSVLRVQNASVTIIGHYKPPGHFQKRRTFSANTRLLGIVKFSDVPLDQYEVIVKKQGYENFSINTRVSVPGKDKVGHFVTPNNLLKINLFRSPYLVFDGSKLAWIENNNTLVSWSGTSGRKEYQSPSHQKLEDKGPLPEGRWIVRQSEYQKMPTRNWMEKVLAELGRTAWPGGESAWGKNRIWIHPVAGTEVFGRSGFSIHGGDSPGSAGCIDLTSNMPEFIRKYLKHGKDMTLVVNYDKKSNGHTQ